MPRRSGSTGTALIFFVLLAFIMIFAVTYGIASYQSVDNETRNFTVSRTNITSNESYEGNSAIIRGGLEFSGGLGFMLIIIILILIALAYFLGI